MPADLKRIAPRDNAPVIKLLESALARAKAGETTGVVLIEESPKTITCNMTKLKNRFETMGYIVEALLRVRD